ncbi:hypothetical protein AA0117_g3487 [Alternaria alternata]|uniref:Uncharacterized protein n=1 Tax=Alternaria alternata TaxID=5599 RepID=A0A4Q4NP30_ALTAL|nr:hypothetical protein AA0117_g3487 [Alternaria alternata]
MNADKWRTGTIIEDAGSSEGSSFWMIEDGDLKTPIPESRIRLKSA